MPIRKGNVVRLVGETAIIELKSARGNGLVSGQVIIDPDDVHKLDGWTVTKDGRYPSVHRRVNGAKERKLLRLLLWEGIPPDQIEHINGDKYDCRKSNMRPKHHDGLRNEVIVNDGVAVLFLERRNKNDKLWESLVDIGDIDKLKGWKWTRGGDGYVVGYRRINGEKMRIPLHRHLTGVLSEFEIDHENHNKLDNRQSNLRVVTRQENMCNRGGLQTNNTSGFIGVSWHGITNKWRARIKVNGVETYLGLFDTAEQAAIVRDCEAKLRHGKFATLNTDLVSGKP